MSKTYANVRDLVSSVLGDACAMTDEEMGTFFPNCLTDMWVELRGQKFYSNTWTVTLLAGETEVALPADLWQAKCFTNTLTGADIMLLDSEPRSSASLPAVEAEAEPQGLAAKFAQETATEPASPSKAWCVGGNLVFDVAPEADLPIEIVGQRYPSQVLWEDEILEDRKVRRWLTIDLPELYHSIYGKCVLGMAYAACDDPGMADYWRGLAAQEFAALNGATNEPLQAGLFVMGGNRRSRCETSFKVMPRFQWEDALPW